MKKVVIPFVLLFFSSNVFADQSYQCPTPEKLYEAIQLQAGKKPVTFTNELGIWQSRSDAPVYKQWGPNNFKITQFEVAFIQTPTNPTGGFYCGYSYEKQSGETGIYGIDLLQQPNFLARYEKIEYQDNWDCAAHGVSTCSYKKITKN